MAVAFLPRLRLRQPYKVKVTPSADVDDFRDSMKTECSNKLDLAEVSDYRNKEIQRKGRTIADMGSSVTQSS